MQLKDLFFHGDAVELKGIFDRNYGKTIFYSTDARGWDSVDTPLPVVPFVSEHAPITRVFLSEVRISFFTEPDRTFSLESSTGNSTWTQEETIQGDGSQITRTYTLNDIDQPTFFRVRQL